MSLAVRIGWVILIAATLYVGYFSHLGALGFVGPDEPRYAWIARDMAETGDWVTPRLYGQPWFEKPVLYYWGAALSFKLFGVNEAAARLPSALSATLATLALAWLAWRIYGDETARWMLVMVPTTIAMVGFSYAASTDMIFSGMLTIAMAAAAVVLRVELEDVMEVRKESEKTRWAALIAFGFFLGAAVLAKGPAGILICGGAVFFWALFTRRWRDAFRLLHPAAIAAFCATALPWYILCARRNPDFLRVFVIEHNFKRYLTPEFQHIQPFWFYGPILLIGLLPWVVLLSWRGFRGAYAAYSGSFLPTNRFLLAWGLFPVLFFSFSKSKLPGYILPSILPFGLLLAHSAVRLMTRNDLWARRALAMFGLLCSASVAWILYDLFDTPAANRIHWTASIGAYPLLHSFIPLAGIGGLAVIGAAFLIRVRGGLILAAILFLLMLETSYDFMPVLDAHLSPRFVASEISAADVPRTYEFGLPYGWHYGLNYYLRREIPEWTPAVTGTVLVVAPGENLPQLKKHAEIVRTVSEVLPESYVLEVRPLSPAISSR